MIYIKDMDMPVDCLACRISCKHESYMAPGRPADCPLEEAKDGDLISRDDAIRELNGACSTWEDDAKVQEIVMAIPSAEQVAGKLNNPCDSLLKADSDECKEQKSKLDLISRADAIEAVTDIQDGSGQRYYLAVSLVDKIRSLPSADAVSREVYDKRTQADERIIDSYRREFSEVASAEAEDRLYIKIYADDEPSVKAEKLYQICGETQNREVTEWLKEYFPAEAVQIPIKLEKRYPESKDEDITDAFMRGYLAGRSSAEAVQGWIPCSERLPDVDVEVLTTTDWSEVLIAWHRKDGTWETEDYILANDEILAWMPLPTPYKGGDSE